MKIQKIFWLCFFILIFSCDPLVLESDIRVLVNGKVLDNDGTPIANAEILVYANKGAGLPTPSELDKKMLGHNFSDTQGNFSVTSVLARDDEFTVEVKATEEYSLYVYQTNTLEYVPSDLVFSIPTITLNKLSNITYNITKTSSEENTLYYNFKYIANYCVEVYDEEILNVNQSLCEVDQQFIGHLDANDTADTGDFKVPLGSVVQFTSRINDEPNHIETFTVNQENYVFEFSY